MRVRHNRRSTVIVDIRRAAVCVGFLVVVMTPVYARAVDLHNVLTGYALSSWTEGDGRSLGGVSAIVQDLSGYLWLGTDIGLVRFDGWRFTRWDTISRAPLPRSPIVALSAARDGTLWIGFADGAVRRIKDGEVLEPLATKLEGGPVKLSEDHNGTIWAVTNETVGRFRGGRWEKVVVEKVSPAPSAVMVRAIGAHLWIGSKYGLYKWIEESDTFDKSTRSGGAGRGRRCQSASLDHRFQPGLQTGDGRSGHRRIARYRVASVVGSEGQSLGRDDRRRLVARSRGRKGTADSREGLAEYRSAERLDSSHH